MLTINFDEAEFLKKLLIDVHIIKTCKTKHNRGKIYVEETKPVLFAIEEYRENHD